MFEMGFATAVVALSEKKIVPPADSEKMIGESLEKISAHSERLANIAR